MDKASANNRNPEFYRNSRNTGSSPSGGHGTRSGVNGLRNKELHKPLQRAGSSQTR